jgi:hypothetical protein
MKALVSLLGVGLLLAAPLVRADFVFKQTVTKEGDAAVDIVVRIKGDKVRVDFGTKFSSIRDAESGDILTLIHDQKKIVRLSVAQTKAYGQQVEKLVNGKNGGTTQEEYKPTGEHQTINGYACDGYTKVSPGGYKVHAFFDKDFPNFSKILPALQSLNKGIVNNYGLPPAKPEKLPGMTIQTEVDVKGHKTVTTLVSVEETDLTDADFVAPDGYTEAKREHVVLSNH